MNDDGQTLYELENQNEALVLRVADLEKALREILGMLVISDLPYRKVFLHIGRLQELLGREISSYHS